MQENIVTVLFAWYNISLPADESMISTLFREQSLTLGHDLANSEKFQHKKGFC